MEVALLVVHVLVSLAIIGLVLIQQGKGADAGASFGGGASQTVFGAAGSATFLTRTTKWLAIIFFLTSLSLAWVAREKVEAQNDALVPAALAPAADTTGTATGAATTGTMPAGIAPEPAPANVPAVPVPPGP